MILTHDLLASNAIGNGFIPHGDYTSLEKLRDRWNIVELMKPDKQGTPKSKSDNNFIEMDIYV